MTWNCKVWKITLDKISDVVAWLASINQSCFYRESTFKNIMRANASEQRSLTLLETPKFAFSVDWLSSWILDQKVRDLWSSCRQDVARQFIYCDYIRLVTHALYKKRSHCKAVLQSHAMLNTWHEADMPWSTNGMSQLILSSWHIHPNSRL